MAGGELVIKRVTAPGNDMISRIAGLENEVFGRGGLNEWHLPIIARQGALFVAEEGENLVGAASLIRSWTPEKAFLIDLAVAAAKRRQGAAQKLMKRAGADLLREGFKQIELTVAPDNEPACALYAQLGFERRGVCPDEYGTGRDRILLGLDLS